MSALTDWITAAATTVAAVGSSGIAWLAYRWQVARELPIVEVDVAYEGSYIVLKCLARNRSPETLVIGLARIRRPRGAFVSATRELQPNQKGPSVITKPTAQECPLEVEIEPLGEQQQKIGLTGFPPRQLDRSRFELYVLPPAGWSSGTLTIDLRISSIASTIRKRRMTIKRFATTANAIAKDEPAKSQA